VHREKLKVLICEYVINLSLTEVPAGNMAGNMAEYQFTLIFAFERYTQMAFKYQIDHNDHKAFYDIVSQFFTSPLRGEHCDEILRVYPGFRYKFDTLEPINLITIFNCPMRIDGIEPRGENEFIVFWSTDH
jgi:hypothetical protein